MFRKCLPAVVILLACVMQACTSEAPTSPAATMVKPIQPCFSPGDPERNIDVIVPTNGMPLHVGMPARFVWNTNGACGDYTVQVQARHPGGGWATIGEVTNQNYIDWTACGEPCNGMEIRFTGSDRLGVIAGQNIVLGHIHYSDERRHAEYD